MTEARIDTVPRDRSDLCYGIASLIPAGHRARAGPDRHRSRPRRKSCGSRAAGRRQRALIGTVDNVMRPVFARFGKLHLSTFVLLTSIFGGLAIFGTWGLLLGPLFARLAKEALIMARLDRLHDKRAELDAAAAAEHQTE